MISAIRHLIDIIYPPRCHICLEFLGKNRTQDGLSLCKGCFEGLSPITPPLCPVCGRPFKTGLHENHLCEDCLRKRPLYYRAGAPYLYEEKVMEAVHSFKYGGRTSLGHTLGSLLARFAEQWLPEAENPLIMPIPLHPRKLRERGFNQSLVLARHVASRTGFELDFLTLRRIRYTLPQAGLKGSERRRNVRRAFELTGQKAVKGRTVLLVDDVATTGSTLNECARVLIRAGAERVNCLVLARTKREHKTDKGNG